MGIDASARDKTLYPDARLKEIAAKNKLKFEEVEYLLDKFMYVSSLVVDDKAIDVKELQEALGLKSQKLAGYIFSAFDKDKNKKIDFEEFVQGLRIFSGERSIEDKAKFCFDIYDINKDGSITKDELKEIFRCGLAQNENVQLTSAQIQKIIDDTYSKIDLNKDNSISFDEFLVYVKKTPSVLNFISFINK